MTDAYHFTVVFRPNPKAAWRTNTERVRAPSEHNAKRTVLMMYLEVGSQVKEITQNVAEA